MMSASQRKPAQDCWEESQGKVAISLCLGDTGKPVLPCATTGEPQSAEEAIDHTPPTASCLSPTSEHGRLLKGWQGEWRVGLGRPRRNPDALEKSRMGHSSQSVGKPRTPGGGLKAKAPSLWEYGVQR